MAKDGFKVCLYTTIDSPGANNQFSAIKKEDKERIKNRALEAGIVEPAPLLALHNALVIAKILRYEFPSDEWYAQFLF